MRVRFDTQLDAWVLGRYKDVALALADSTTFSSAGAIPWHPNELAPAVESVLAGGCPGMPVLVNVDPPLHTAMRSVTIRAFSQLPLELVERRAIAIANDLVDAFAGARTADLVDAYAWHLPLLVLGTDDWVALFKRGQAADEQLDRARGVVELQRYFSLLLRQRSSTGGPDLLSRLAAARVQARREVPPVAALGVALDLLVAGHMTITRALSDAVMLLLLQEPARTRALRDSVVGARALEEVLRLEPPTRGVFRITTAMTRFGNRQIPRGARFLLDLRSANRDPRRFARPEAFAPERAGLAGHLSFGRGAHRCPGARLARVELRAGLSALLRRLPDLRLEPAGRIERDPNALAGGCGHLDVTWRLPPLAPD